MTTKSPVPKIAYAVLNAATLSPFDHDGWCQVMPAGHVRARDGRPETPAEGWLINEAAFNRMVARVVALNQPVKIDYNHQTLFKQEAAPAAGFVPATPARFRWDDKTGVWVKPDWNPPALERLKNNEFPYFSPVMGYDARSGEPLELRMLAITGDPGLTGMRPVAALSAEDLYLALTVPPSSPKEPAMNPSLNALLAALGLTVPEGGELTDEVITAALSAVTTLKSQADKAAALETTMAALSADLNALKTQAPTEAVDLRRYSPVETYNAVREQVVSLSADLGKTTLVQTLDKAEQDGRILKSERPYLEGLGNQFGVAALSAQLATRQPIAALTRVQTETLTQPPQNREKTATVALSAEELQARARAGDDPGGVPENQDRGRTIMPTPITPSQITALMTGFRKEFQNGLGMAPSHYQQVATTVASTSKSNTYGWLGQFPAFREWVGSRSIQQMKVYGYAINNKTYEGTVAITRDDFEDDNLGAYSPLFQKMGRAAAAQPDELVFTALRDGNKTDCYDGKPFFDSEHPVYPKVDGSGDAEKVANQFIEKTGSGAAQKAYDGAVWYLLDCSRALKPLISRTAVHPSCSR